MKVLLDENLDHRLRKHLTGHQVFTAGFMAWNGLKNGQLLEAAESEGFDLFITGDQSLTKEQTLVGRKLAIVILSCVEWRILKDYLARILTAVDSVLPGSYQAVDCGTFSRKRSES